MKILILSCDTGEGHNSAGRAVKEAAESKGHTVEMMDMFLLSGKRTSHAVAGAYVGIVKHIPFFFGFIYKVGMLISSSRRKSPVYFANALLGKKLASYIDRHDFDIVLTPHLYPAETMTYMKKKNLLHIPAVAVGTDYTCIPFWEETNLDYYVIPHEDLIPEYVKRGVPEEKLLPYGIPVRQDFCRNLSKEAARKKLHLPMDVPMFLVMSGSMGMTISPGISLTVILAATLFSCAVGVFFGIYPAKKEFLEGLRALCDQKDIILIFDEIQCGMGRTGCYFAWQSYGVKPDVMTCAKALGCGVPVGAFVLGEKAAAASLVPGDHGTTYGGNPFVCAAVSKVFDIYENDKIIEHVQEMTPYLEQKLDELVEKYDFLVTRRGKGLMQGVVCKLPVGKVAAAALEQGLIVITAGADVLRFVPPLVIEKQHVDEMIEKLEKALLSVQE